MSSDNQNLDSDFIKKDKIVQHTVNGISRFLILWVIMENGPIHGYGLLKLLNKFFENLIDVGSLRKSSPSRVYPILKDMEKNNLIRGEEVVQDNKKVIYYEITDAGRFLVHYIRDSYQIIRKTGQGSLFVEFLNSGE
ncbi:PadR family transcriptional regulator [uncultured Methanobrevibacter sp.]|uniref:PadR family transcriptional regulator n=1 Tax=uncultured Methanobrevibacter sp. TaxID=253161 RepID=UPI0025CF52FF|nr:PadR family transcriptional regulator [uncultured Methanobrevibacter sp.]